MHTPRPLTKPTKQRKMLYEAPAHVRHRLLAAHLSPQLRASHLIKTLPVRTGDTVKVMRGDHKNVEGKISRVDLKKYRIYVEGLTREKADGSTIPVSIHPSKVMVTHLNLDDKWRREILETKKKATKKRTEAEEKPKAKRIKKAKEEPIEAAVEEAKGTVEAVEEKPAEAVEEVKKIVEEKPVAKEKPAKKVTRAKKSPVRKKVAGKAKAKTRAEAEEVEKEQKPEEKKKPKRTAKKAAKKTEEGEG
jgi:large subunit ribosomal protein L24